MEPIWGQSLHINMNSCNDKIKSPEEIEKFINGLCKEIKMNRFGPLHLDRFGYGDLEGYSCMQFIETSSITCHFDEQQGHSNRAFIDIFSCKEFDAKSAKSFCKKFFGAKSVKSRFMLRR